MTEFIDVDNLPVGVINRYAGIVILHDETHRDGSTCKGVGVGGCDIALAEHQWGEAVLEWLREIARSSLR